MSKLKRLLTFALFAATLLSACSKNENSEDGNPKPDPVPTTTVIVSGGKFKLNTATGYNDSIPAYWVDGVEKQLPNFKIAGRRISSAIALSKSGKLHYIATGRTDGKGTSQYWINGLEQVLPSSLTGEVTFEAAAMKNEQFHLIGDKAAEIYGADNKYWIDGVAQPLPNRVTELCDISLSTDEVYMGIAGQTGSNTGVFIVPGAANPLSGALRANRIAIHQGDVHVITEEYETNLTWVMKYFVGGVKHDLPNSSHKAHGLEYTPAMAVSGGKVHIVTGFYRNENYVCKYWIDGIEQPLPVGATKLTDITVFEGKIYILGAVSGKATYWIDGVPHTLPAGLDYTKKLIVTKK